MLNSNKCAQTRSSKTSSEPEIGSSSVSMAAIQNSDNACRIFTSEDPDDRTVELYNREVTVLGDPELTGVSSEEMQAREVTNNCKLKTTENYKSVGKCTEINCRATPGGLPTMFEQPEVQYVEFAQKPKFCGRAVLDGATKGECLHIPLGPLEDTYLYMHVHVMYAYIHMHMRNKCLPFAVRLTSYFLVQLLYHATCGAPLRDC